MIELTQEEVLEISGAKFKFTLNLGTALGAIALGVVTGGFPGLGMALCSIVMAQGFNSLDNMRHDSFNPECVNYIGTPCYNTGW